MPVANLIAQGGALLACVGIGATFLWLGIQGVVRQRLRMRVGEVKGPGARALGVLYVAFAIGLFWFGVKLFQTPLR